MENNLFGKEVVGEGIRHPLSIFSLNVIYGVSIFFSAKRKHAERVDYFRITFCRQKELPARAS